MKYKITYNQNQTDNTIHRQFISNDFRETFSKYETLKELEEISYISFIRVYVDDEELDFTKKLNDYK